MMEEKLYIEEDCSPCVGELSCDSSLVSSSSEASSIGTDSISTNGFVEKASEVFFESDEDEEADEKELVCDKEISSIHNNKHINSYVDRQRVMAYRQNQLNNFILRHSKAAIVNRQDHHIMLRQLIGEAYFRDPQRVQNRPHWKKIIAAIRKEYWGANAIFNLSPDPYHEVLAKLSSMMLWNGNVQHWKYEYCEKELERRHTNQLKTLELLNSQGKLFL